MLGGVGAAELRDAREAAAIAGAAAAAAPPEDADPPRPPLQLLLGGTRLLTPASLAELILA